MLRSKGKLKPRGIKRTTGRIKPKKRRKKGEITKLKAKLWQICRQIKNETTCYTCGRQNLTGSNRQLGHYIASSLCSVPTRYSLDNLRIQCYNCNINKSGNTLQFRRNLIKEVGIDAVNALEEYNETLKGKVYPKQWFLDKITEYKKLKLSTLQSNNQPAILEP